MRKFLAACMIAAVLPLAGCIPDTSGANAAITASSTALHTLCGTAETVLPIVAAYQHSASLSAKLETAQRAVTAYCSTTVATDIPSAIHNLTIALTPILPYAIRTPAALDALRATPNGRQALAYARQRGWIRLD